MNTLQPVRSACRRRIAILAGLQLVWLAPAAGAADGAGPIVPRSAWDDPAAEAVFAQRFTDPAADGLRLLAPAGLEARAGGVVPGAGPGGGNAHVTEVDLPAGGSLQACLDMPETDPRGLSYRFSMAIETDPPWPDGGRFLELRLNNGGASDGIHAAEPLEHPVVRDGLWLEQATREMFTKQAEYLHRGWTRYEGDTANAFLRRFDGRKAGQPLGRVVQLALRNLTEHPLRVRISLADVEVVRRDITALPEMKALLGVSSPFIRFTRAQMLLARQRIAAGEKLPASLTRDLQEAEKALDAEFPVPRKRAGWPEPVFCQTAGCSGRPKPEWDAGFRCPVCNQLHSGGKLDGLLVYERHRINGEAVRCLGLAWQYLDDDRYARKAEEILLAYAAAIKDFQLGHNWLGDCWLMENLLLGYDSIREWASPATRQVIEQDFLMTMVRRIHHFNHHYPEGYTGLLRTCLWSALLAGDVDWIYYLASSPSGNRDVVLRHGLTDDGISLKGAAYHGSLVRGIGRIGQTIENCGVRFFDEPVLRVYRAIPQQLFPDNSLPAFGHANVGFRAQDYGVETAYRSSRDPVLLALTSPEFRADPSKRLFWEDPSLPEVGPLRLGSTNLRALGLTMLRSADHASALALSWGAPQRNDPARLDFQYFGAGGHLLWSSGIAGYTNPVFSSWYQQSVSRNGLVVDEQTQEPRAGRLLALDVEGPDQFVAAELVNAYPDTRWVRIAILLEDGAAVLIDRFSSPRPRTVDWVCHLPGDVEASPPLAPGEATFGAEHGYGVLTDVVSGDASQPFSFLVRQPVKAADPRRGVRVTAAPQPGGRVSLAKGRTGHSAQPSPVAILRRTGVSQAVFAALLEPLAGDPAGPAEVGVAEMDERGGRIVVNRGGQIREIRFHDRPGPAADAADGLGVVIDRR